MFTRRSWLKSAALSVPTVFAVGSQRAGRADDAISGSGDATYPGLITRQRSPDNLEFPFATLKEWVTPTPRFFVRSHFNLPQIRAEEWTLRVEGHVEQPFTLGLKELMQLPAVTQTVLLECAGNGRVYLQPLQAGLRWEQGGVSNAEWTGTPLAALLNRARVKSGAVEVILEGQDRGRIGPPNPPSAGEIPFARSLPIAKATDPHTLLAWQMNGEPLTPAHGFPARAIIPGWYGMASIKWLKRIVVTDRPYDGYFQTFNYTIWTRPENGLATNVGEAFAVARRIGYPVLVRPSYVLGGRAMEIVYDDAALDHYMQFAVQATPDRPILVDKFLEEAIEVDVDAISDGKLVVIGGIMEHIEEAGVHSGDSTCVLPPHTLSREVLDEIRHATKAMAKELHVVGLMNVQFAVKDDKVYVLEVNPRASRTAPFVSKAIGAPLAKLATKVMCGISLEELGFTREITPPYYSVKAPVFPFNKFPGVDIVLGPEMRSTGEVMGIDEDLGHAFAKAYLAAGIKLPRTGKVFVSVKNSDKRAIIAEARTLAALGYELVATEGTWRALKAAGIPVERVNKVHEGRPHVVDSIKNREIALILNTPYGKQQRMDDSMIRAASVSAAVPCITTRAGISAIVCALAAIHKSDWTVRTIQEHQSFRKAAQVPVHA